MARNNKIVEHPEALDSFLSELGARCDWQVALPLYGGATAEQWRAPGSAPFVVIVYGREHGFDIYTSCADTSLEATFADARKRIGKEF